jgi:hypothetical protein
LSVVSSQLERVLRHFVFGNGSNKKCTATLIEMVEDCLHWRRTRSSDLERRGCADAWIVPGGKRSGSVDDVEPELSWPFEAVSDEAGAGEGASALLILPLLFSALLFFCLLS